MNDTDFVKESAALGYQNGMAYVIGSLDIIPKRTVQLLYGIANSKRHELPPCIVPQRGSLDLKPQPSLEKPALFGKLIHVKPISEESTPGGDRITQDVKPATGPARKRREERQDCVAGRAFVNLNAISLTLPTKGVDCHLQMPGLVATSPFSRDEIQQPDRPTILKLDVAPEVGAIALLATANKPAC